jgi:hypothetical protein
VQVQLDDPKTKNHTKTNRSNKSEQIVSCDSSNNLIKRERPSLEESRSAKLSKTEIDRPAPAFKTESCCKPKNDIKNLEKYQKIVQEVYLHGSHAQSDDNSQSGSPKTPTLSYSSAEHVSRFMESFAGAFPSETEDLVLLLDTFMERRQCVNVIAPLLNRFNCFAGLPQFVCAFQVSFKIFTPSTTIQDFLT